MRMGLPEGAVQLDYREQEVARVEIPLGKRMKFEVIECEGNQELGADLLAYHQAQVFDPVLIQRNLAESMDV